MMMQETLVPLNDGGVDDKVSINRTNSLGSQSDVDLQHHGDEDTLEYRIQAKHSTGKIVSLWHDVSLTHVDPKTHEKTPYFNFVCEIPKFTRYVTILSFRSCFLG